MARRRFFKRSKSSDTPIEPEPTEAVDEPIDDLPPQESAPKKKKPRRAAANRSALFNRLTWLFLILTPVIGLCYLLIFLIPTLPLNPLPPYSQAMPTYAPTPTTVPTATPTRQPTSTNTPTSTPRPTNTRAPTETPRPTLDLRTPITGTLRASLFATRTPSPTPLPTSGPTLSPFSYTAEVRYQRAQLYGTNWAGIAGLIFGLDLKHQPGIGVKAWGDEPLGTDGALWPSGTAPQYGPSGWEFTLGDRPISGKYKVQVLGPRGEALSPVIEIELQGDPRANLAYIIFRQNH